MTKITNLTMWRVFIILFVLYLNSISVVMAVDCGDCDPPPTYPGNASRCQCETVPTIVATFTGGIDTIDSTHPVTLKANGGCPPYKWTTSSSNYSLNNSGKTENDFDPITLTASSGSCGTTFNDSNVVCSVTVMDSSAITPKSATITIRNTVGYWGPTIYDCQLGAGGTWYEKVIGDTKYQIAIYDMGAMTITGSCTGSEGVTDMGRVCNDLYTTSPYNTLYPFLGFGQTWGRDDVCFLFNTSYHRVEINFVQHEHWECP